MTPRRIRNYVAPLPKPRGTINYSRTLTSEQADRILAAFPGATLEPTSFGFRVEPLTRLQRAWRWFR